MNFDRLGTACGHSIALASNAVPIENGKFSWIHAGILVAV